MNISGILSNDKKALGLLTLVVLFVLALPWVMQSDDAMRKKTKKQAEDQVEDSVKSGGAPMPRAFRGNRELSWIAQVDYAGDTGNVEVDLQHRDIPIDEKLKVHANFIQSQAKRMSGSRWLARQSNGVYRASGVQLEPGKWTMGLTGYRNSRVAFRLEKVLNVK